jgi:hypothetical protein
VNEIFLVANCNCKLMVDVESLIKHRVLIVAEDYRLSKVIIQVGAE